jgi:hypothetical protein
VSRAAELLGQIVTSRAVSRWNEKKELIGSHQRINPGFGNFLGSLNSACCGMVFVGGVWCKTLGNFMIPSSERGGMKADVGGSWEEEKTGKVSYQDSSRLRSSPNYVEHWGWQSVGWKCLIPK